MPAPLTRLLIANRGEIACRIARTAHRLGIDTVGVYSDADASALHVEVVDRAVRLGGAAPTDSYLRGDLVVQAALDTGCDALHPGYGFLAENAGFAQQVIDAGLIWVGPTPEQIRLLGDKIAAKQIAVEAGVPCAPILEAEPGMIPLDVPLPALVKAAAGGGGRGMRLVRSADELADAVMSASREASAAFGDGTVFVEPYMERARHVEVQIVGDAHGTIVHLGERECSIQRRNQKVIEEAPSPGITDETRRALLDGARKLAEAVGYRNAGTVEFLVGDDGAVNFLEVNTRLQVEHPVTEAVTGIDIVELQLLVASGEPLPLTQDDVIVTGHAIEARLIAEDPRRGWLPATGRMTAFSFGEDVRIDSGVRAGSVVSADYDSLLAKVVAHAPTRVGAAGKLARALRSAALGGPATNRDVMVAILGEPDFLAGETQTTYLGDHESLLLDPGPDDRERTALLLAAVVHQQRSDRASDPHWGFVRSGWRNVPASGHRSVWRDGGGGLHHVEEVWTGDAAATVLLGKWPEPDAEGLLGGDVRASVELRVLAGDADSVGVEIDGVARTFSTVGRPYEGITVSGGTGSATWVLEPRFVDHVADEAGSGPVSPLPGTVIAVHVEAGQVVADGDLLIVVEAMKMEHKIVATAPARVVRVCCAPGDRVEDGDLLVELDSEED